MNFEYYDYAFHAIESLGKEYNAECKCDCTSSKMNCSIDGYQIIIRINKDDYDVYFQDGDTEERIKIDDLYATLCNNLDKYV